MLEKEIIKANTPKEEIKVMASFLKNPNVNTKETAIKKAEQKTAKKTTHEKPATKTQKAPKAKVAKGSKPQQNNQQKTQMKQKPKTNNKSQAKAPTKSHPKTQQKKSSTNTKKANTTTQKHVAHSKKNTSSKNKKEIPIHIIPLGGLNEIGKNMTAYECQGDIFIVDCGLAFPDADMLGVDLVIPDFNYVEKNIDKIKGLVITHGHEDHIGAIPYLLKKFNVPIYASPLALGLIKGKLKEHGLLNKAKLNTAVPRQTVKMGCMTVEFLRVNHSIPDALGMAIHSPAGVIIQTGDFKIDYSPIEGQVIDLARFAELGSEGVLCLLSDSTNAERPGSTMSESKVGQSFQSLFSNADGKRIIIASFASNIHRIQQIINTAEKFGRKVAVSGRSMENVVGVASELGYLTLPEGILVDIDKILRYPKDKTVIITTGSQGEPMSALSRMASGNHRKVSVTSDDFIIISATPIPGNEKHVTNVINDLLKLGAEVIYEKMYEVHVSGHACQDELRMMLAITKPKYFMPVHGEFKHLKAHSKLAKEMGVLPSNINIGDIGQILELSQNHMKVVGTVEAGRVLVDGLGVGDVGSIVLRDRRHLAQDGLIIVVITMESATGALISGPDIVSRGFVYVREAEQLITDARQVVKNILDKCSEENIRDWATIKLNVRDGLSNFIYKRTKRGPMILPIITEI